MKKMYTFLSFSFCFCLLQISVAQSFVCAAVADFTSNATNVCLGDSLFFTNNSTGAIAYKWYLNGNLIDTNTHLQLVFHNAGNQQLILLADEGTCTDADTFLFAVNPLPQLSLNANTVSCYNSTDGVITASASGGNSPYFYAWSTGSNSSIVFNLRIGLYWATVTDANGCQRSDSARIIGPDPIMANTQVDSNIACKGDLTGQARMEIMSGTVGNVSYLWSNGETTAIATALAAGWQYVTATDINQCYIVDTVFISEPLNVLSYTHNFLIDNGLCDGELEVIAAGGVPPYTFIWANGATGAVLGNLCAGNYALTLTDANACSKAIDLYLSATGNLLLEQNAVQCYPNPAYGELIQLDGLKEESFIIIFDALGRKRLEFNSNQNKQVILSIEGLEPAIYWIQLFSKGSVYKTISFIRA